MHNGVRTSAMNKTDKVMFRLIVNGKVYIVRVPIGGAARVREP